MSLRTWIFGEPDKSEVQWLRKRVEQLEEINEKQRLEAIAMCNANTAAQIEAYRQSERDASAARRVNLGVPQERETPPGITDNINIQDHLADGLIPPEMQPSDEEIAAETQRGYRDAARARDVPTGTTGDSEGFDEPIHVEARIG